MPWEKSFEVDEALERAMEVFWAKGYAATSTQNLLANMGINRGSLYATFGNKNALFIKALRHYIKKYLLQSLANLQQECRPKDAISGLFRMIVDAALADKSLRGCFLVNTALDLAPHNKEVQVLVSSALDQIEVFFIEQIEAGQKSGSISCSIDKTQTASTFLGLMLGVRVVSRLGPNRKRLESTLSHVEMTLG